MAISFYFPHRFIVTQLDKLLPLTAKASGACKANDEAKVVRKPIQRLVKKVHAEIELLFWDWDFFLDVIIGSSNRDRSLHPFVELLKAA